jgi:hypothetical protein
MRHTGSLTRIPVVIEPAAPDSELPADSGDAADRRVDLLTELALAAFASHERAWRWLRRPRREFGGMTPLEMAETPAAFRQVEIVLRQLAAERSDADSRG